MDQSSTTDARRAAARAMRARLFGPVPDMDRDRVAKRKEAVLAGMKAQVAGMEVAEFPWEVDIDDEAGDLVADMPKPRRVGMMRVKDHGDGEPEEKETMASTRDEIREMAEQLGIDGVPDLIREVFDIEVTRQLEARLRAVLAQALGGALDTAPAKAVEHAPRSAARKQPAAKRKSGGGAVAAHDVTAAMRELAAKPEQDGTSDDGWLTSGEIAEAAGVKKYLVLEHLRSLHEEGIVETKGQTNSKRYRLARQG